MYQDHESVCIFCSSGYWWHFNINFFCLKTFLSVYLIIQKNVTMQTMRTSVFNLPKAGIYSVIQTVQCLSSLTMSLEESHQHFLKLVKILKYNCPIQQKQKLLLIPISERHPVCSTESFSVQWLCLDRIICHLQLYRTWSCGNLLLCTM